jgi:hypothetical protein
MKAVLVLFCVLAVAHAAIVAPTCPTTTKSNLNPPVEIIPFYKYSFEMPKAAAMGSVFININDPAQMTQGLWFRATADASTAITSDLHVKLTINRQAGLNDTEWTECSLTTGTCTQATTFGLSSSQWNVTVGDIVWLTFFPSCAGCSKTVEFSVETAWYIGGSGSTTDYPNINLINNTRTMVFSESQGSYVNFYTAVTSSMFFYTSVVYDNKAVTGSAELVLYWTMNNPYNGTGPVLDQYPSGDGIITGNYLTQRPFYANTSGTYFLTTFVKTGATGNTNSEFTIKVGFNAVPCSSGSMLSISLFLALLPFLASLWN